MSNGWLYNSSKAIPYDWPWNTQPWGIRKSKSVMLYCKKSWMEPRNRRVPGRPVLKAKSREIRTEFLRIQGTDQGLTGLSFDFRSTTHNRLLVLEGQPLKTVLVCHFPCQAHFCLINYLWHIVSCFQSHAVSFVILCFEWDMYVLWLMHLSIIVLIKSTYLRVLASNNLQQHTCRQATFYPVNKGNVT